ncbi:hypothetical protein [Muricoccus pecuniae]|uniref:Uncharacterized protein n=1 Tax=Muricoccus pecuniae TaxID=693023 RepID=A0A840YHM8_9PROT|nr:hypothetical protein [Roseomonas pecuniae]MBB5695957.1 hypothetical protein [Roseomonas pecuniae]
MSDIEFTVAGLTNLDILELKGLLKKEGSVVDIETRKRAPEPGKYNDPALATALVKIAVDNAPVVLPTLVSALAIWIAKGKKAGRMRGKSIEVSLKGIKIATYEAENFQEADGTAILNKLSLPNNKV